MTALRESEKFIKRFLYFIDEEEDNTMSDKLIALIEKLNNKNYHHWALRMKVFLSKESCWDSIVTECPDATEDAAGKTAWEAKSVKAHQYIVLCVGNDQLVLVNEAVTAKEAWEKLKNYHQKSTLSVKVRLLRKICKSELPKDGDMEKHLLEMSEAISQLRESGYKLEDDITMYLLLSSVSDEEYGSLITALEGRDEKTLTIEVIRNKLLEEYEKHKNSTHSDSAVTAFKFASYKKKFGKNKSESKKDKTCHFCKKPGHFKSECYKLKNLRSKSENKVDYANCVTDNETDHYALTCIKNE